MFWVTDAEGSAREVVAGLRVAPHGHDLGTLLAVDTLRRLCEVLRQPLHVHGVPTGWEHLGVLASRSDGPADVTLHRPGGTGGPPYAVEHRMAWLGGVDVGAAVAQLRHWRSLVAGWAEEPSRPMCAQVQEDVLAVLQDDLDTARAIEVLQASLELGLPPGCLFETWAWCDRMLGVELTADVGRTGA